MDRYLIRGFIDGLLSTLGIVIGASTAISNGGSVEASHIIIAAGLGGGIANGFSNILGAFMGEKTALYERYREVEKAMLKDDALKGTKVDEKLQDKVLTSGVADGVATIIGSVLPIIPFFLIPLTAFTALKSLYISIGLSLGVFFILGAYIGKISKENMVLSGLKMVAFGGVTAIIVTIIRTVL